MMCHRPELPEQWDDDEVAGSEDLCFGSGAGSGCGL